MKALQQGVIGDCNFGAEKTVRCHHNRLKKVTKTIDTSMPRSYKEKLERSASPGIPLFSQYFAEIIHLLM